jgi:hypothetical protein
VGPNEERPEFTLGCGIPADDDFMSRAALRLRPCVRPPGDVRRIAALGHDSFEGQPAGRAQHRLPAFLEMLDKANTAIVVANFCEKVLQLLFPLDERTRAQIFAALK